MTSKLELIPVASSPYKNQLVIHFTFSHGDADFQTTDTWVRKETEDVESLSSLFLTLHEIVKLKYEFQQLSTLTKQNEFLLKLCQKNGLPVKTQANEELGLSFDHKYGGILAVLEKVDIIYYGDQGNPCYSVKLKE